VPKNVTPELAGLVTPMANGVEWSLMDGEVGYNSVVLIQGPGQQGLSQTVICKQAGAALIIVTGTAKDAARMKVAKELGADYVIDVSKEDPLARIMEITGGQGVDVALDCTAGAGTTPLLLGIDALKRKGGVIVAQGEMKSFPELQGLRTGPRAARLAPFPAGESHHPPFRFERRRSGNQVGRRQGRARCDSRLVDAVAVSATIWRHLGTTVIPAQAGIQAASMNSQLKFVDSRLRGSDEIFEVRGWVRRAAP
jgi:threonine dehydrogenase-like Zn-dependent dehydrogenase